MRVIDQRQQRPLLRRQRDQTQRGRVGRETIDQPAGLEPERRPQRLPLRRPQPIEMVEHRRQELRQSRVGQLELGLDPLHLEHRHVLGAIAREAQQCRLAHPRLATNQQCVTSPGARRGQQALDSRALGRPSDQHDLMLAPMRYDRQA
jgi:hypothetical protein